MEIKGVIDKIEDTVVINDKFQKRYFTVMHWNHPETTEYILFQVINDRCDLLDKFKPGDKVLISFQLKGKPYTGKDGSTRHQTTCQAWKIVKDETVHNFN